MTGVVTDILYLFLINTTSKISLTFISATGLSIGLIGSLRLLLIGIADGLATVGRDPLLGLAMINARWRTQRLGLIYDSASTCPQSNRVCTLCKQIGASKAWSPEGSPLFDCLGMGQHVLVEDVFMLSTRCKW